jgi:thiol-disulfide isomerase/thioredoxin
MKRILIGIIVILFSWHSKGQYLKSIEGQAFPEHILQSVLYNTSGKETTLGAVLDGQKGNTILIEFWASWCKACLSQAESMKKIHQDYKNKKLVFLYLSTDTEFKQWIRGLSNLNLDGLHYRIDEESKKGIQNYLKIKGVPYYLLLNKDGHVFNAKMPWPHLQKFRDALDMLLHLEN